MTGTVAVTESAAARAPAAATQDQGRTRGAATGVTKMPKTGVGTMAPAPGTSVMALLAGVVVAALGMVAMRTQQRA